MKKSEKYKKEQEEIIQKLLDIVEIKDNYIIRYELDNDEDKHKKINELAPDIKKYFACNNINGIKQPQNIKKPWLSIVRQVLKTKYNFISTDYMFTIDGKKIRTKKFFIYEKES